MFATLVVLLAVSVCEEVAAARLSTVVYADQVRQNLTEVKEVYLVVTTNETADYRLIVRPHVFGCIDLVLQYIKDNRWERKRVFLDTVYEYHTDTMPLELDGFYTVYGLYFLANKCVKGIAVDVEITAKLKTGTFNRIDRWPNYYRYRVARSLEGDHDPIWVSLNEFAGENYVWLAPTMSAYGYPAPMLYGGAAYWTGKEYIKIPSYEEGFHVLVIPGLYWGGPLIGTKNHLIDDGTLVEVRNVLRYSKRDAAWVLWNYKKSQPVYAGSELCVPGRNYSDLAPVINADIPGMIFKVRPLTDRLYAERGEYDNC